jgi:hypothetical protein
LSNLGVSPNSDAQRLQPEAKVGLPISIPQGFIAWNRLCLAQRILEDMANDFCGVSDRICCGRIGDVVDTFNDLKRISNGVAHPRDGFEEPKRFSSTPVTCQLVMHCERRRQGACERASHNLERAPPMDPVMVDEPLQNYRNAEHCNITRKKSESSQNFVLDD